MKQVAFSDNWNNKLQCKCFSTIRLWQPEKYRLGEEYQIFITYTRPSRIIGTAALLLAQPFELGKLTEGMALLDTGYNRAEVLAIIRKMYSKRYNREGNALKMGFYVFRYIEPAKLIS